MLGRCGGLALLVLVACAREPDLASDEAGALGSADVVNPAPDGAEAAAADAAASDGATATDGTADTIGPADGSIGCAEFAPCSDGNPCTYGDQCSGGACVSGPDLCACQSDADCAIGANLCLGKPYCDKSKLPHACKLAVGSAVVCDASMDTTCSQMNCDPGTGACKAKHAFDGTSCNDGNACSVGDACLAGACVAGADTACACQTSADCKDDADACNGTPYCDTSLFPYTCKQSPATVVQCPPSGDPCKLSTCNAVDGKCGLVAAPDLTPCNDGDPSTAGDVCIAGACKGSAFGFCAADSDCNAAEDGNLCNGTLYCDKASKTCKVNAATVIACPTVGDTTCLKAVCQPKSAQCLMLPVAPGTPCEDEDPCTKGDHCESGACTFDADTCVCDTDVDCLAYDDKNVCNGKQFCNTGLKPHRCQDNPATVVLCPTVDDTNCSKNACVPLSGECSPTAAELTKVVCDPQTAVCRREQRPKGEVGVKAKCEDGDVCTVDDVCADGACKSGTFVCPCKDDADCADKTDGDLCKGPWYCDKSATNAVCKPNPAKVVVCSTVNDTPCVKSKCQPASGQCKPALLDPGTPCEDGEPCTEGTLCIEGQCKAGAITCECIVHSDCEQKLGDGNLCNGVYYCDKSGPKPKCTLNPQSVVECPPNLGTLCLQNVCNPATGFCSPKAHNEGKACEDGSVCSVDDACTGGLCVGKVNGCDDGDACTSDACLSGQGCVHAKKSCDDGNACTDDSCVGLTGQCAHNGSVTSGKLCDADGTPCTQGDACVDGACKAGVAVQCAKAKDPCAKAVCIGTSASESKCVEIPQADGVGCDDVASCTVGNVCKVGVCVPGPKGKLWEVSQGPLKIGENNAYAVRGEHHVPLARVDGGVTVLVMATKSPTSAYSDQMYAISYDQTGKFELDVQLASDSQVPRAAVRLGSGAFAVATWNQIAGIGSAEVRLLDASATKMVGAAKLPQTNPILGTITRQGKVLTVAGSADKSGRKALVLKMTEDLSEIWTWHGTGLSGNHVARAVVAHVSGEVTCVAAIRTTGGSPTLTGLEDESLVRLDAAGNVSWTLAFSDASKATGQTVTSALLLRNKGTFLAIGQAFWGDGLADSMVVELAGPTLGVMGSYLPMKVGFTWNNATIDQSGRVVLAGARLTGADRARLQILGDGGNSELIWDSLVDDSRLDHVLLTPDQRLIAVGGVPGTFFIQVRDSFGNRTCSEAGACYGVSSPGCDDGNACTADSCEPKAGCQHQAVVGCKP